MSELTPISPTRVLATAAGLRVEIDAECPHRKGKLVHGFLNPRTGRITCPLHRSTFDLATGCQLTGPASGPLHVVDRTEEAPA